MAVTTKITLDLVARTALYSVDLDSVPLSQFLLDTTAQTLTVSSLPLTTVPLETWANGLYQSWQFIEVISKVFGNPRVVPPTEYEQEQEYKPSSVRLKFKVRGVLLSNLLWTKTTDLVVIQPRLAASITWHEFYYWVQLLREVADECAWLKAQR